MSAHTRLLLFRHAEVEEKYQRVFGGRIDMNLSALGHRQAAALAEHLRATKFDAIYASPMKRVQQTLAPLLAHGAPVPTIWHDLREIDFGDWTGLSWDQVQNQFNVAPIEWLDMVQRNAIPNAEPVTGYRARVEKSLRQITTAHPGQTVGVFCHGGVIRAFLASALGLPLPLTANFEVDYASVTHLEIRADRAILELLNHTPWAGHDGI